MHLGQQLTAALAVGVAVVLASSPIAVPVPGVQIRSPPIATRSPLVGDLSSRQGVELEPRRNINGQPAQKPLMGCPEMFNDPILHCSSCGGESASTPGTCAKPNVSGWVCLCDPTGPNGLTTTLVVTTVGDETATGTYELDTMTQYAGLREHITIMTTATATTTGDSGLETVAVVVLAGGVAWFLADFAGGAGAVAALSPPESANNHDDDKTCPDPKDKCADCGGNQGMCTTGTDTGCGCEEATCPADGAEDQPVCSDDACAGQNGQCTTGDHEGCNCKKPDCPDLNEYIFWGSDCGGRGDDGKCKGDPEDDMIWVGCDCIDEPDWSAEIPALKRPNAAAHQAALMNMPKITYPDPVIPTPAPLPNPECDSTSSSKVPWNVFSPGIYTNFCNTLNGGDKTQAFKQTVDSKGNVITAAKARKRDIFGRTPPPNPDSYSGYIFELDWSGGDGSCSSDCSNIFYTIAQSLCGHTAGEQNIMASEAKLDTGCGVYSYKITGPPDQQPVVVAPTQPDLFYCSDPTVYTKFTLAQAEDAVSQFCTSDISLLDAAVPTSGTYIYDTVKIQLQLQWTHNRDNLDPNAHCGSIKNPDGSGQKVILKDDCAAHFLMGVNNCNTDTVTDKFGARPFMWSSPIGCVDFYIYGDGLD